MPPKVAEESVHMIVNALCTMMAQQESFKIDSNAMAAPLGLTHGKNVGRKIDGMIKPYGWRYEAGKIVQINGAAPQTPAKAATASSNGDTANNDSDTKPKSTSKKASSRKKRASSPDEDTPSGEESPTKKAKSSKKAPKAKNEPEPEEMVKDEEDASGDEK